MMGTDGVRECRDPLGTESVLKPNDKNDDGVEGALAGALDSFGCERLNSLLKMLPRLAGVVGVDGREGTCVMGEGVEGDGIGESEAAVAVAVAFAMACAATILCAADGGSDWTLEADGSVGLFALMGEEVMVVFELYSGVTGRLLRPLLDPG